MKITLVQQDIEWADVAKNRQTAEKMIMEAERSDLYILPEMWSTGFATSPEGIAESDEGSLLWMMNLANRIDAAIAGSVATEEDGKYYNRFYFVKPEGDYVFYDKKHLFTYGGENNHYSAGGKKVIVEWRGVTFLLQVCYDLRFPVFSRNGISEENKYDVAIYVASWPQSRRLPWDVLLRARAIENQCFVCGVNRVGRDKYCEYDGGSIIIDPYGKDVVACEDSKAETKSAEIDIDRLRHFREKFPVLKDMD